LAKPFKWTLIRINGFIKGLVLVCRPHVLFGFLTNPLLFLSNTLSLTKWISKQETKNIPNDFYIANRDYTKRLDLFKHVVETQNLDKEPINYLEFGVAGGNSFRWFAEHCTNPDSKFSGFDTFEGLPEDFGLFKKGEMSANIPQMNDVRVKFYKGLFQETLPGFIKENSTNTHRKIIHLDADLFTATLYTLTSFGPYLRKGDILFFDEFNVPNHEFYAFKVFSESFYIKTRLLGAVNNYLQVALIIE
jgi:hypothetical protein